MGMGIAMAMAMAMAMATGMGMGIAIAMAMAMAMAMATGWDGDGDGVDGQALSTFWEQCDYTAATTGTSKFGCDIEVTAYLDNSINGAMTNSECVQETLIQLD